MCQCVSSLKTLRCRDVPSPILVHSAAVAAPPGPWCKAIPAVVGVSLVVVGGVAITDYVIRVMQHRPCMCWCNAICSAGNTHLPTM